MDEKIILRPAQTYLCDTDKDIESDKTYLCESGSSFVISLKLTGEQIQMGYHSGECGPDIEALMLCPKIKEQLDGIYDDTLNKWWEEFFCDDTDEEHANATRERRLAWLLFDCCAEATDGFCYEMR